MVQLNKAQRILERTIEENRYTTPQRLAEILYRLGYRPSGVLDETVDDFYSLPPRARTKARLKQMLGGGINATG